jgi:hypothetical protein
MLGSTPTVIVTSGVDWPAIAASISTGVAAVAGIGGTIWVAVRSWHRDDERAKTTEKRRLYAACLTALNDCLAARVRSDTYQDDTAGEAYGTAVVDASNAVWELQLIAPKTVGRLASDALFALIRSRDQYAFTTAQAELINAMRADIGWEPPSAAVAPETAGQAPDSPALPESVPVSTQTAVASEPLGDTQTP